jgi:general secretion pathway protein M
MKAWWSGLNTRERGLVGTAGVLVILVILWQFLLVPAFTAKADAKAELDLASARVDRLSEAYGQRRLTGNLNQALSSGVPVMSSDAFKGAVTRDAADKGLSISRLQGDGEESITLVFERVQPQQLFYWIQNVETSLGGQVRRLNIEQVGEGAVRASVEFERGVS